MKALAHTNDGTRPRKAIPVVFEDTKECDRLVTSRRAPRKTKAKKSIDEKYKAKLERMTNPALEREYRERKRLKQMAERERLAQMTEEERKQLMDERREALAIDRCSEESDGSNNDDDWYDEKDGFVVPDHSSDDDIPLLSTSEGEDLIDIGDDDDNEFVVDEDNAASEEDEENEEEDAEELEREEYELDAITARNFPEEKAFPWPKKTTFPDWQLCHILARLIKLIYKEFIADEPLTLYADAVQAAMDTFDITPVKIVADHTIRSFQLWHILFKSPYLNAMLRKHHSNEQFNAFFDASEAAVSYRFREVPLKEAQPCLFSDYPSVLCVDFFDVMNVDDDPQEGVKPTHTFFVAHRYRGYLQRTLFITQFRATVWRNFTMCQTEAFEKENIVTMAGQREWLRRHIYIMSYRFMTIYVPLFIREKLLIDYNTPINKLLGLYLLILAGVLVNK